VATPNYGYEKRQKELAKKRKKEDKLNAKAHRKVGEGDDASQESDPDASGSDPEAGANREGPTGEGRGAGEPPSPT
jgi:hypothetical protein